MSNPLQRHIVRRDAHPALEFEGFCLGEVSSRIANAPRWTELRLYRCAQTQWFVCETLGLSTRAGEHTRRRVEVVTSFAHIPEVFKRGNLARELYRTVGLPPSLYREAS